MSSSTSRSEDGTQNTARTKRIGRACDSCYSRKIKCDGATPQCNWCQHHNMPCTFRRAVKKPKKQRSQAPGESRLSERVERIEKLLVERLPQNHIEDNVHAAASPTASPGTGTSSPSSGPCFGKLHFAGLQLGDVSSCNGVPLFSREGLKWLESRTGQSVGLEKLRSFGIPWQSYRPPRPDLLLAPRGTVELPDINCVREYVSIFSCSALRLIFPFIDPVLFEDTLKRAYHTSVGHQDRATSAEACVCSFLAVAGIFSLREESAPSIDCEAYAWKAQCLLPQLYETTLDGHQATLMLLIFHLVSGNLHSAIFMNTLSAAFIFMLGAHTREPEYCTQTAASTPDIRQRRARHLRNLFWVNYTLDKELALRTRQPPAINDDHCDLTLPPEYGKHLHSDTPTHLPSTDALPECHFPGDLRLSMIKSHAYSALYSVRALQKSDAELIKAIRETDNELETWRLSLPPKYRPTISFSHENPPAKSDMDTLSVILRLEYHHCMTVIHQASGRCSAWASHQSGVMEGVSSSLALSVGASRSSLSYLQTTQHALPGDSFWLVVFYPMSAVLTLFCNILLNPLAPTAPDDLELLIRAPALIRGLPIRHLTANEVMHIKHIDDFVAELSRLAKRAITNSSEHCHMY